MAKLISCIENKAHVCLLSVQHYLHKLGKGSRQKYLGEPRKTIPRVKNWADPGEIRLLGEIKLLTKLSICLVDLFVEVWW